MSEDPSLSNRLVSLDAFRGITIAGMTLVNNPGTWSAVYPPLRHAEWNGWTPTDLVFPFFMFIVGVAMTFSFSKRLQAGDRNRLYLKVLRRSALLFAIGLFLNTFPAFHLTEIRIPGVLQRIAVGYLFASLIVLNTGLRGRIWWFWGLLLSYWALMSWVPVPGHGAGDLSVEGNFAGYLDNLLMHGHLYRETWDPEGILSTIPSIATVLAGVLSGHLVRSGKPRVEIAGWIFVLGWCGILLGLFWGIWFPINKNLWTSSYVLFTAGAALQFLGVCYFLVDVKGWTKAAFPAVVFGVNALALYVLSGIVSDLIDIDLAFWGTSLKGAIYQGLLASWMTPLNASLAFGLGYVLFWWLVMYLFYRRRIFVKL